MFLVLQTVTHKADQNVFEIECCVQMKKTADEQLAGTNKTIISIYV